MRHRGLGCCCLLGNTHFSDRMFPFQEEYRLSLHLHLLASQLLASIMAASGGKIRVREMSESAL